MSSPAGWHPDPVPAAPGQPPQLRYWDGSRWTEHVAPAQGQPPEPTQPYQPSPPDPGQPGPFGGSFGGSHGASPYAAQQPLGTQPYGGQPYGGQPYGGQPLGIPTTTPDGAELAGWWQRVGALVIDGIIVAVVAGLVSLPWLREVFDSYSDFVDEALNSSSSATPDTTQLQSDVMAPLAIVSVIQVALGFAYNVGFLMWKQATPGKLALGLRVRLRERPGPMPVGTVLLRWVAQFGVRLLGLIPLVGCLTFLYWVLDYLWPLWDGNRQALHDKAAKTNVVRSR